MKKVYHPVHVRRTSRFEGNLWAKLFSMKSADLDESIRLEAYCAQWPTYYAEEVALLHKVDEFSQATFAHFGSTSVPGMPAKPIIDILIGVNTQPPSEALIENLKRLDYEYFGEAGVPGRHYFRKRGPRDFNLALVQRAGNLWNDNLLIRDYLRTHVADAQAYADIKRKIIQDGARTLLKYSNAKSDFMKGLLEKARSKR